MDSLPTTPHHIVDRLRAEGRTTEEQARRWIQGNRVLKLPYHAAMLAFFCIVGFVIGWVDHGFVAIVGIVMILLALGAYLKKLERLNEGRVPLIHYADWGHLETALGDTPELWDLYREWQRDGHTGPLLLLDQQRLLEARDEILRR